MRAIPNHTSGNSRPTSYRINIGSERARQNGLIDSDGSCMKLIPIKSQNGLLLIPVDKPIQVLVYKGFRTEVYERNGIFCGEIVNSRSAPTWFTKSQANIEASFHAAADSIAEQK